jgi:hypothetical protein
MVKVCHKRHLGAIQSILFSKGERFRTTFDRGGNHEVAAPERIRITSKSFSFVYERGAPTV